MILAPLSINPDLSEISIRRMVREFADGRRSGDGTTDAKQVNVVVLVPSDKAAEPWESYADEILHVKDMRPTIKRLTDGEHVGVVVLVNKYDGVDLPDDACRLLVIDGIPTPLGANEQREAAALIGSSTFEARKVQRIEQGMGRGIRDVEDYCAVVLMTRDAALTLRDRTLQQFYSPATRSQIELSQMISEQIENEGIAEIRNALNMFLEREEDWIATSRAAMADVEYDRNGKVTDIAVARRTAFDKATRGDLDAAVEILRAGIDSVKNDLDKGWHLEELVGYQQLLDPMAAQRTLSRARELNSGVLKPNVSPAKKPIKGPALQGDAAAAFLMQSYTDPNALRLGFGSLFDNIAWGVPETASLAEEQVRLLGLHLGFASIRPEKEYSDGGPDNLWGLTPEANAIIELKTEVNRADSAIIKTEAGQLLSSLEWDKTRNPEVTKRIPVMLHPSSILDEKAHLPEAARIITPADLDALRQKVMDFANELAAGKSWSDPKTVANALKRNHLTAERVIAAHSSQPSKSPR